MTAFKTNRLETLPPVSRWELIDAISKLHVINDCPSQSALENACGNQLTKGDQNDCQCSDCGTKGNLT